MPVQNFSFWITDGGCLSVCLYICPSVFHTCIFACTVSVYPVVMKQQQTTLSQYFWEGSRSVVLFKQYVGFPPLQSVTCLFWTCLLDKVELKNEESKTFCNGVILSNKAVLTTASCTSKFANFRVFVGKLQNYL